MTEIQNKFAKFELRICFGFRYSCFGFYALIYYFF